MSEEINFNQQFSQSLENPKLFTALRKKGQQDMITDPKSATNFTMSFKLSAQSQSEDSPSELTTTQNEPSRVRFDQLDKDDTWPKQSDQLSRGSSTSRGGSPMQAKLDQNKERKAETNYFVDNEKLDLGEEKWKESLSGPQEDQTFQQKTAAGSSILPTDKSLPPTDLKKSSTIKDKTSKSIGGQMLLTNYSQTDFDRADSISSGRAEINIVQNVSAKEDDSCYKRSVDLDLDRACDLNSGRAAVSPDSYKSVTQENSQLSNRNSSLKDQATQFELEKPSSISNQNQEFEDRQTMSSDLLSELQQLSSNIFCGSVSKPISVDIKAEVQRRDLQLDKIMFNSTQKYSSSRMQMTKPSSNINNPSSIRVNNNNSPLRVKGQQTIPQISIFSSQSKQFQTIDVAEQDQQSKLEAEREQIRLQKEELEHLQNIWRQNIKDQSQSPKKSKSLSKSPPKRRRKSPCKFVEEGEYQNLTNSFARKTIHWDEKKSILNEDKLLVADELDYLPTYSKKCCGNSPHKSHSFGQCQERPESDFYRHKEDQKMPPRQALAIDKLTRQNKQLRYIIWKEKLDKAVKNGDKQAPSDLPNKTKINAFQYGPVVPRKKLILKEQKHLQQTDQKQIIHDKIKARASLQGLISKLQRNLEQLQS